MTLYQQLKEQLDLRDIAVRHLTPKRTHRKYIAFICVFHGESSNRGDLSVFADGYYCNQCGAHGDIFDWLQHFESKNRLDVLKEYGLVKGDQQVRYVYTPPAPRIVLPFTELDLEDVEISHTVCNNAADHGYAKALEYWRQWGIAEQTINDFNLGYVHPTSNYAGYTIPHYYTTAEGEILVKGLKLRRDDDIAPQLPKYIGARTSLYGGIYNDRWTTTPDGSRTGPKLDFCFVTEDEKTTWVLNQLGYPSVSYKQKSGWQEFLSICFKNVSTVIIVADNDAEQGMKNALNIQEGLGDIYNKIIQSPLPHKQFSDMSKELGLDTVEISLKKMLPGVL